LARNFEVAGEIALAPIAFGAEDLETIVHAPLPIVSRFTSAPNPKPPNQSTETA
jgi:hypothetical protein